VATHAAWRSEIGQRGSLVPRPLREIGRRETLELLAKRRGCRGRPGREVRASTTAARALAAGGTRRTTTAVVAASTTACGVSKLDHAFDQRFLAGP
jgi:hypothetical protein